MAKNQHNSNSPGLCQKLYNATLRRISHPPKNSIPAHHVNAPAAAARQQLPNSGEEVIPIEFDPHHSLTLQKPKEKTAKNHEGSSQLKMQENEKFSDYISRVKNRMVRGSSNVGNAKISSRPDSFNDNVSNYIRRAQGKMRASSTNVAGGNSGDII